MKLTTNCLYSIKLWLSILSLSLTGCEMANAYNCAAEMDPVLQACQEITQKTYKRKCLRRIQRLKNECLANQDTTETTPDTGSNDTGTDTSTDTGTDTSTDTGSDDTKPTRAFNGVRPYGPRAPWNIPVAGLPRHKESSRYATYLWNDTSTSRQDRNFNLNFDEYTYPVYNAEEATTEFRVQSRNGWGNLNNKTIPFNPAWSANKGTDGQIIILDPATGREWNLWQAVPNTSNNTVEISNGNLCPGDYFTNNYDSASVQCPGSRGVGINYLAMLVRPWEIEKGKIEHALSMPIRGTSGQFFVPPATKLEFPGKEGNIPEGMRFALDVTDKEIEDHLNSLGNLKPEIRRALRIIFVAMRDYGWFITDTSGGTHLQFEAPQSAADDWQRLGLFPQQNLNGKVFPRDGLDGLIREDNIITIAPSDQY